MGDVSMAAGREFASLFSGSTTAYGKFVLDKGANEAKVKGKCSTVKAKITEDLYYRHLVGECGVGVIPIRSDNTVLFAVIDFDVYTKEKQLRVLKLVDELRMPLVPFRSKSGGLHLYIFFSEPVKAVVAVRALNQFKELLDMDEQTEIFPKQTKLTSDDAGNWINLPFYNVGPDCKRHMWNADMTPEMSIDIALQQCKERRQTEKTLAAFFENLPLMDAPPCLQRIYIAGQTTSRNNYLLALGRYYKAKYGAEEYKEHLIEANDAMVNPITREELMTTVMMSLEKKNYSYGCSKEPINHFCNKKLCATRKYGLGGKEVSNMSFGEFRQVLTDPPSYEWMVNDNILRFDNSSAIMNQETFRRQCIDVLCVLPARLNDNAWTDIVNTALANVIKVQVDVRDDVSSGAFLTTYIVEFITKKCLATTKAGITRGLVYKDKDMQAYIFSIKPLAEYLTIKKELRVNASNDIKVKLIALGGSQVQYALAPGHAPVPCWRVPFSKIAELTTTLEVPSQQEFVDNLEKEFMV